MLGLSVHFIFCFPHVLFSYFLFFLSSWELLEHFLEIHFDLSMVVLSVSLCIAILVVFLNILLHIHDLSVYWCHSFTGLRAI